MVSMNTNPAEDFYLDPNDMEISGVGLFAAAAPPCTVAAATTSTVTSSEDVSKRIRKPYTITKSRESWTEPEHDKFLEALHLFDRDWKKIEAFIGSKTAIQIRSHAQKYFLKVQKNGINEHLPPPRPKRKADHPYPQKASKLVSPVPSQTRGCFQTPSTLLETGNVIGPNAPLILPISTIIPAQTTSLPHAYKTDLKLEPIMTNNCTESTPLTRQSGEENHAYPPLVLPDFGQVYNFIGSVFDPDVTGHMQKLKKMDPINAETVLLLMRNLSINLTSPDFDDHKKMLLSSYGANSDGGTENQSGTEFS